MKGKEDFAGRISGKGFQDEQSASAKRPRHGSTGELEGMTDNPG
jgi:hypothetical protein